MENNSSGLPCTRLVLRPQVLFLDEPRALIRATSAIEEMIQAFHRDGLTIVMTTHNLGQARRLADDVIFSHAPPAEHTPPMSFTQPRSEAAAAFLRGELLGKASQFPRRWRRGSHSGRAEACPEKFITVASTTSTSSQAFRSILPLFQEDSGSKYA